MDNIKETLQPYGYPFQTKVIAALLSDRLFAGRIFDLLDDTYFDSPSCRWISKVIKSYFHEYKNPPTLEVFKSELIKLPESDIALRTEIVSTLRDIFKSINAQDLEYVKTEITQFCRRQEFKSVLYDSIPLIRDNDFDSIVSKITTAYKKGIEFNLGHIHVEQVDSRYSQEENVERITTGWPIIDEITGGGIPKKRLATITAALGAGKTFMAVHLGAAAVEAGYTVIHITLELDEREVGQRYDAKFSGFGLDNLSLHIPDVKKSVEKLKGKLIIKEFLSGASLFAIEAYLDQCIMMGIVPDMVIIDYDELVDMPRAWDSFRPDYQLQLLHREFRRRIAIGKNVVLWVPTQASREGSDEDVVLMKHNANSYGKGREIDFGLTLSRKEKDKVSNTARITIGKSRIGPDGMTFPAHFDTSRSLIKIFQKESTEGQKTQEKMQNDADFQKQYALNRWQQVLNSNRQETKTDLF